MSTTTLSQERALQAPTKPRPATLDSAIADLRYTPHVRRNAIAALGVGASLAVGVLASFAPRNVRKMAAMSTALSMGVGLTLVRSQLARWFTEQPQYDIDMKLVAGDDSLEVRRYRGAAVARTFVASNLDGHGLDRPIDEGFHRLFSYISGENAARQRLEMVAPVTVQPKVGGTLVSFFLPASHTLGELPQPNDPRVEVMWRPAKRIAAVRYGGPFKATDRTKIAEQLADALRAHAIDPIGETIFAGYDAPYVFSFLTRNEAWVEV